MASAIGEAADIATVKALGLPLVVIFLVGIISWIIRRLVL
jgi:hypothetical protein